MEQTKEVSLLAKFDEFAAEIGSANKAANRIGIPASTISMLKKEHTAEIRMLSLQNSPHILTLRQRAQRATAK